MGLSIKNLRRHLHIIRSISILEQLCNWNPGDPPLDYFLHIGGTPMIVVGDILLRDDVQHTLTRLVEHVGSPSLASIQSSSKSHSHKSQASIPDQSSIGSPTGTRISFTASPQAQPSSPQTQMSVTLLTVPDSTPIIQPLVLMPVTPSSPVFCPLSTGLPDIPEQMAVPGVSIPPISQPPTRSACFPNVDLSTPFHSNSPRLMVLHRKNGNPVQTSYPAAPSTMKQNHLRSSPSTMSFQHRTTTAPNPSWDQYKQS